VFTFKAMEADARNTSGNHDGIDHIGDHGGD
jgi:hypothetical protein